VLDECEELRIKDRATQDPDTAWWRIKECRSLKGAPRQVAQSVAAWRERWGITNDRPPRFVLPDLPIAVIASKPPQSIDDLAQVRGVDAGQVRGSVGEEILQAVKLGQSLSPEQLRLPPAGDTERESRPGLALVSAWIGQMARTEKLDASLLATRSDILAFLRNDPAAKLANGWRASVVGNVLGRITRGEVAVALDKSGDLVLVDRVVEDAL
jgi:ribonuclease D